MLSNPDEIKALLRHPAAIALLLFLAIYVWYTYAGVFSPVPENLPWMGKKDGEFFAGTRANLRSFSSVRSWLEHGYQQYSKKGKAYAMPDVSGRSEVIIPKSKIRWLLSHSDNVASTSSLHYDVLQGEYAFTDPHLLRRTYHEHILHKSLARNIPSLIPDIQDEIEHALDDILGLDTESFKDITVMSNMMEVIARVSNRMFVGKPLCRLPAYTKIMGKFATAVITCMTLIPLFPSFLRPIVGRLIALPNRWWWLRARKYTRPLVEERKANILRKAQDPSFKYEPPNDYITWHINIALAENELAEMDTDMITRYLMPINFAAIHTTAFTLTCTLYDVLSADPSLGYLEGMREEAERVFAETNGVWTKASLSKLHRIDSVIRESMRISTFVTRGLQRKILAPEGITEPEQGFTMPYGGVIGTDVWSVHMDPEYYENPNTYDAFRFSRPIEEAEKKAAAGEKVDEAERLRLKQTSLVTTSETFLSFGHGRHACPGRFFVNHELKMLLAYISINYEVERLKERPKSSWFGTTVVPDDKAAMRLRRRKQSKA